VALRLYFPGQAGRAYGLDRVAEKGLKDGEVRREAWQGLKPDSFGAWIGMTEVMPCYKAFDLESCVSRDRQADACGQE
jgi:hypothetical protein